MRERDLVSLPENALVIPTKREASDARNNGFGDADVATKSAVVGFGLAS